MATAIIIGVMLFFLFRYYTMSFLENNDKKHSFGIRISVTIVFGFVSLLVLTATIADPSKAGFIAFMISLGVYLGFKKKTKDAKLVNLDQCQNDNPLVIEIQQVPVIDDGFENQLSANKHSTNTSEVDNAAEKISFLQKINIFRTLSGKDIIIIVALFVFSIVLVAVYFNRDYITTLFDIERINEEVLADREFKRTNYFAKIKYEDNRMYYNIEIYNKHFGFRANETNVDVIFVDVSGYSLEKIRIKASDLIKNDRTYYYKDNLQIKPEIFLKIHNIEITYTENQINR